MEASLEECRRVFDGQLVLYSNSAGLQQFDPEGGLLHSFFALVHHLFTLLCCLPVLEVGRGSSVARAGGVRRRHVCSARLQNRMY